MTQTAPVPQASTPLSPDDAATYAEWFAVLADPTRVRVLHEVATSASGALRVGDLATALGISQATCSHHVRKLADVGFVRVDKVGTASLVSVNAACCTGLPHAADVVMGTLTTRPCCPGDVPADVTTRAMTHADLPRVREIYAEGIATRQATFETEAPSVEALREKWLPGHRWVAELADAPGQVIGWTGVTPVSSRACYSVGMLLDVGFLLANLPLVLAVAVVVLVVKTLTTAAALAPLRVGWRQAVAAGLLLGQVGEFSFVLLTVGEGAGLSPLGEGEDGSQVFVATTVLLMMLTPAFGSLGTRLLPRGGTATGPSAEESTPAAAHEVEGHVLMLGWGADSIAIGTDLRARGVPVVMTTLNPGGATAAEAAGLTVVRGDAMRAHVLEEAGLGRARLVVVAEHDAEEAARVAVMVRGLSDVPVVVRATGVDLEDLAAAGVDHVVDPAVAGRRHLAEVVGARVGDGSRAHPDVSRLVHYRWPSDACPHGAASVPVQPGTAGCEECLRDGERWVHLRMCLSCGHVGCCDSSPGRHATAHHRATDHPLMASAEPGETWAYCFLDDTTVPEPRD